MLDSTVTRPTFAFAVLLCLVCGGTVGCTREAKPLVPGASDDGGAADAGATFACRTVADEACVGTVHYTCEQADAILLRAVEEDCAQKGEVCVEGLWCVTCVPGTRRCEGDTVQTCREDGSGWDDSQVCDTAGGDTCDDGRCGNACELTELALSYVGCEFYAVDLDNASVDVTLDASQQQYAVAVSNLGRLPAQVVIEENQAAPGQAPDLQVLADLVIPPGDLEVFALPRNEVDGSSSNRACDLALRACPNAETCVCSGAQDDMLPCVCRRDGTADGANDGPHTALTTNAFRIRSSQPVVAYQFNPLDNVDVFSNDASLLLPRAGLGTEYTVLGWPQTIAHSDDPEFDWDSSRDDEDLRATLTIVGVRDGTEVRVRFPDTVGTVVGGDLGDDLGAGDVVTVTLNEFDVLNLETAGLNSDFTGTRVEASREVAVWVGSEASDVPRFESYSLRQCCADHLEEQLPSDGTLGRRFFVPKQPSRREALNRASLDGVVVGEVDEPDWVRILAVNPGVTQITTSLDAPYDAFNLAEGGDVILRVTKDFELTASARVSVMQALGGQQVVGVREPLPGGDPALVVVPPVEQFRKDYVLLVPELYAFDFVSIVAPATASVTLDGVPLDTPAMAALACEVADARGGPSVALADDLVYRCPLSQPKVMRDPLVMIDDGFQQDGVHTLVADQPIGVVVSGFDAYVSYAYPGGLNLTPLE